MEYGPTFIDFYAAKVRSAMHGDHVSPCIYTGSGELGHKDRRLPAIHYVGVGVQAHYHPFCLPCGVLNLPDDVLHPIIQDLGPWVFHMQIRANTKKQ